MYRRGHLNLQPYGPDLCRAQKVLTQTNNVGGQ